MSASEHHVTAPEDRIPLRQKSAYATGMFVNNLQAAALPAMVVILNLGLKMDPALVGLIAAIPRDDIEHIRARQADRVSAAASREVALPST